MVIFIVPIKSEKVSSNWQVFSLLVDRTMRSITNQTNKNFKVIAVCHEIPQLEFKHPNLEFIQVNFPPPTDEAIQLETSQDPKNYRNAAKEADKAKKIMAGISHGRQYNPDYFMVVDADDCISNKLVEFVESSQDDEVPGYYFKKGYIYNEGSALIFLNKNTFNVLCGTCIIIRSEFVNELLEEHPRPLFNHDFTELKNGQKLKPLPFAGAIYSIGNTENYCSTPEAVKKMNTYNFLQKDFFENMVRKLSKYRLKFVTSGIRNTYGLTKLDFSKVFEEID